MCSFWVPEKSEKGELMGLSGFFPHRKAKGVSQTMQVSQGAPQGTGLHLGVLGPRAEVPGQ